MNRNTLRTAAFALVGVLSVVNMSCMTTYDSYGRPMQTVDPAVAVAGVAAAGLIGYAIANDNRKDHYHHYHHNPYPRRGCYDY